MKPRDRSDGTTSQHKSPAEQIKLTNMLENKFLIEIISSAGSI